MAEDASDHGESDSDGGSNYSDNGRRQAKEDDDDFEVDFRVFNEGDAICNPRRLGELLGRQLEACCVGVPLNDLPGILPKVGASVATERIAALETIVGSCSRGTGDDPTVAAACSLLADRCVGVRETAAAAVAWLAAPRQRLALDAVAALRAHRNSVIRELAVKLLAALCSDSDDSSLADIEPWLQDRFESVKREAIRAIAQVDSKGSLASIRMLARFCEDRSFQMRNAAFKGLLQIGRKGEHRCEVIKVLFALLKSGANGSTVNALECLATLVEKGDPVFFAAAVEQLRNKRGEVRRQAVEALSKSAGRGCAATLEALHTLLSDDDASMRAIAVRGIGMVANVNDEGTRACLVSLLKVRDDSVRFAAMNALLASTPRDDVNRPFIAVSAMINSDSYFRYDVIKAFGRAARRQGRLPMCVLMPMLRDNIDHDSQMDALKAIARVSAKDDPYTLELLREQLSRSDPFVSGSVAEVVRHVASRGNATAIGLLLSVVKGCADKNSVSDKYSLRQAMRSLAVLIDKDQPESAEAYSIALRLALQIGAGEGFGSCAGCEILRLLRQLATPGDVRAVSMFISALLSRDWWVQEEAAKGLARIAPRWSAEAMRALSKALASATLRTLRCTLLKAVAIVGPPAKRRRLCGKQRVD